MSRTLMTAIRGAKPLSAITKDGRAREPKPRLSESKKTQIREALLAKQQPRDIAFSLGVSYTQVMNTRLLLRSEGADV